MKNLELNNHRQVNNGTANSQWGWLKLWSQARTRILLWYFLLMAFFLAVSIPAIRHKLYARVDARVREELLEEVEGFEQLLATELDNPAGPVWDEIRENIGTQQTPSLKDKLAAAYDVYLNRQLTEDDTFLITFIQGKYYKASARGLPSILQQDSELVQRWGTLTKAERGEKEVADPEVGSIIYLVEPIRLNGQVLGVLIVVHATAGERREVLQAWQTVIEVIMVVLLIALVLGWFVAGKVLSPLQALSATAHSISESDLTQRIPITGSGEIAELAKTFNEMMNRLEASFAMQRNFINDAGHELRTPITIIRGHLELMGDDPQEQEETIALVMDELDRMSRFVDDLILLTKAERPDFLHLETVDVTSLTQELFAKAQALADRDWQLDTVGVGTIVVDRQRLTQAVINLAQNATQHTQRNNTIALGSLIRNGQVNFWVRDTGEGIDPTDQKRIFERFARAAKSRRRSEGAGLGLSIVKAIAEAHGGKVHLHSQLGSGSTFSLYLPLEPPQELAFHESNSHR